MSLMTWLDLGHVYGEPVQVSKWTAYYPCRRCGARWPWFSRCRGEPTFLLTASEAETARYAVENLAAMRAYRAGLGASEWEAVLDRDERALLARLGGAEDQPGNKANR